MAESICGPSNPLKTIQNHVNIDRTLQQDRLLPRNHRSKEFRSSAGPSRAQAEVEFEAFQNGIVPADHAFPPSNMIHNSSSLYQTPQPPPLSTWASDFQKLNLSDDFSRTGQNASILQSRQTFENSSEWFNDFNQQQRLGNSDVSLTQGNQSLNMMTSREITFPIVNGVDEILNCDQNSLLHQTQNKNVGEIFDQDDFARVFEQVTEIEMDAIQQQYHQQSTQKDQDTSMSRSKNYTTSPLKDDIYLTQAPIGADAINHQKTVEDDSDSLSLTAFRLLNSIRDEQSAKFQNSQFLELMRRFRDKKATVQGDQVVGEVLRAESNGGSVTINEMLSVSPHHSELTP